MNTKNMPPGLRRYWSKMKGKKARKVRDPKHKRLLKSLGSHFASDEKAERRRKKSMPRRSRRMRNPVAVFKLGIQKGARKATRLYLARDTDKFSASAAPRTFSSIGAAKEAARAASKRYGKLIAAYDFVVVPIGRR